MTQYISDQQRMLEKLRTVDGRQYIGDQQFFVKHDDGQTIVLMDHDKAVAMAKRFLTMEYCSDWSSEFQQLAADLDDYLRRYELGGVAYDFNDAHEVEQDGSGVIFEDAKRSILIEEVGEEGLEKAVDQAEATVESYRAMVSGIGQPARDFEAPQHSDWRICHVLSLAKTRIAQRVTDRGDRA